MTKVASTQSSEEKVKSTSETLFHFPLIRFFVPNKTKKT